MKTYPFVCVEGVDGCGKTTVAQRLAERLNGIYYRTPPGAYASARTFIDKNANTDARFYFYASSVLFASKEIAALCQRSSVVCDRYVYSTIAYHVAMDPQLRSHCALPPILVPDHAFLLVVGETERLRRVSTRRATVLHDEADMETDSRFLSRVEREFRNLPLRIIDTTHLDVGEVVDLLLNAIVPASSTTP